MYTQNHYGLLLSDAECVVETVNRIRLAISFCDSDNARRR